MPLFCLFILAMLAAGLLPSRAAPAADEAVLQVWNFKSTYDSWSGGPLRHSFWPIHDGAMWLTAVPGKTLSISESSLMLPGAEANVVQIDLTAPAAKKCRLEWTTDVSPLPNAARMIEFDLQPGPGPHSYNLALRDMAAWKGQISSLRLQFLDAAPGETIAIRQIRVLLGNKISKPLAYTSYTPGIPPVVREFRFGSLFNNGMVLQRNQAIPVWGHAPAGGAVTVEFQGKTYSSPVVNGRWAVTLPALPAGGPYTLTATQGATVLSLADILLGDVWICSGQSNMGPTVADNPPPPERHDELMETAYPNLRFVQVPMLNRAAPLSDDAMEDSLSWHAVTQNDAAHLSAVAYYFGQEIHVHESVPVGLVMIVAAGTQIEQWMDAPTLQSLFTSDEMKDICNKHLASGLYNGMVAPVIPFGIRGMVWYQGESNADKPALYLNYHKSLPGMIRSRRQQWGEGDFPVLLVQLPSLTTGYPPESWAHVREAQLLAAKELPNVGLDVTFDLPDQANLHPHNKYVLGTRLGLLARGMVYGETLIYSGPLYRSMAVQENKAVISFDYTGGGLKAVPALTGFQLAGADQVFRDATATITAPDQVTLVSDQVAHPVAARYAWSNAPAATLFNGADLPASPFTTVSPPSPAP